MTTFINKIAWKDYFNQRNFPIVSDYDPYFKIPNKKFKYSFPQDIQDLQNDLVNTISQYEKRCPPKRRYPKASELVRYLKDHPDIKLILSDKNLGIVALNTSTYNQLVLQHLQSEKYELIGKETIPFFQPFYTRLRLDFSEIVQLILSTETDPDLVRFVKYYSSYNKWSIPNFHVLVKLHKGLNPLKSRPIVGAVNWITTPVSRVLAKKIFTLFRDQRHIAQNTMDITTAISAFNINIKQYESDQLYLVSLDITDLYTNIDLKRLEIILKDIDPYYSRLMNFFCNKNYMNYNESTYKQTDGIAMGTNCAPELANLYLLKLLDPLLLRNQNVKLYRRYLDDLLLLWYGNKNDLQPLLLALNAATGLGFTLKASKKSVDFLDLKLFFSNDYLEHCTHQKKLNKYGYITPKSCHPRHTFSGFIKGELTRYAINSSRLQYYLMTKHLFFKRLLLRGYQRSYLKPLFQNHKYSAKFHVVHKSETDLSVTNFPITYSFRSNIQGLSKRLRVKTNFHCRKLLPNHSTRMSWKRSSNLVDRLCSSRLTPQQAEYLKLQGTKPQTT